ncbi:MAG: iron-sulfur cluster assembly protein [Nocardioides sp.]|nr:iron-sulfur cluster assembly protein [Nocardioides sp.]
MTALTEDLAGGLHHGPTEADVRRALDVVIDPELDEPITDLGFVRSVALEPGRVEVHLRLPTSFCSPNFAYLMASDSQDAVAALVASTAGEGTEVVVELDDHHDSDLINRGLATGAGYRGTFLHEAEKDLDELRATFRRKAHTAAMERCLTALLRADTSLSETDLGEVVLGDLPHGTETASLLRRRTEIGLGHEPLARVLVDHHGVPYPPADVPMAVRRARSTRISLDGNAHFCRGLLATRYPGSETDQTHRPSVDDPGPAGGGAFFPLSTLSLSKEHTS